MKGRDKELIAARDQKIYERYYYWTEVRRLRFDDALHKLSTEEFFLSESRVLQIIRKLINAGYELEDGAKLSKCMFTGFRFPNAAQKRVKKPVEVLPSLFPETFQ